MSTVEIQPSPAKEEPAAAPAPVPEPKEEPKPEPKEEPKPEPPKEEPKPEPPKEEPKPDPKPEPPKEDPKPEPAPAPAEAPAPAAAGPKTWEVSLPGCGPEKKLGVDLMTHNCGAGFLTIGAVKPDGAVHEAGGVEAGDRIVGMNGATTPQAMLDVVKKLQTQKLSVQLKLERPQTWDVQINVPSGLGVELTTHDYKELYVTVANVKPGGACDQYNQANAATAIAAGDRLYLPFNRGPVGAHGKEVFDSIVQAKADGKAVNLTVERRS